MKMRSGFRTLCVACGVLISYMLSARAILPLQHLSLENGLPQSTVYTTYQDKMGFIWLATGDGLCRYDGKDFLPYKSRYYDTLSAYPRNRNINSRLFEDKYNRIWFSTDAGLSYADIRHRRSRLLIDATMLGNSILAGLVNDTLWVTQHHALFAIDINSSRYVKYPFPKETEQPDMPNDQVYDAVAYGNSCWIIDNKGLLFFDKTQNRVKRLFTNNGLRSVCRLGNGTLLLGAVNGYYKYVPGNGTVTFVNAAVPGDKITWRCIVQDTVSGIVYLSAQNSGALYTFDINRGLLNLLFKQSGNINRLFIDRSRNLWIGTDGAGLYKLDIKPAKFQSYLPDNKGVAAELVASPMVKSIYRDHLGRFWIGSFYNGLVIYDPVTEAVINVNIPYQEKGNVSISVIMPDSSGKILVATNNHLLWMDPNTLKIIRHLELHTNKDYPIAAPVIYAAAEWKKGHFIIGTNSSIFSVVVEDKATKYYWPKSFASVKGLAGWVYNLQHKEGGIIYVCRRNGYGKVQMLDDTTFRLLDAGFDAMPIRYSYRSPVSNILWLATESGLIAYNERTKKWNAYDDDKGLANGNVYAVIPESDTSLWVSTNGGISNIKVQYRDGDVANTRIVNYTTKDGLQSDEFNAGAYFIGKDGTIAFGGINGINWFDPSSIKPNPYLAAPAVTAIELNDTLFATDTAAFIGSLQMPYTRNTIGFSFRALEYTNTGRNKYAYKLEGLDNDWVYTTNDKVRYSNLRPGRYTFLLRVSNNEGVWNEHARRITLVILPPFWETLWFRLIVLVVVAFLIYLAAQYYVKQKISVKMRELEKQEALNIERLRISKDVHDDIGSGLSKITLMAELANKQKNGNTKLNETIEGISQISRDLVGNMRDLVWVLNPENTSLDNLAAHIREYCSDYFENLPQQLKLAFDDVVPHTRILREAQRNIFLTVKEALNNCVKHSDASIITVSLHVDQVRLQVAISDNGRGLDEVKALGAGNGLKNMRQRIEAIGGVFSIASTAKGTEVVVVVPVSKIEVAEIPQ